MEPLKPPESSTPLSSSPADLTPSSTPASPKPLNDDQVKSLPASPDNVHPANVYPPPEPKLPVATPPIPPPSQAVSHPPAIKNFGFIEVSPDVKKQSSSVKKSAIAAAITVFLILIISASVYFGYLLPNEPKYVVAAAFFNTLDGDKLSSASYNVNVSANGNSSFATYAATITGSTNRSGSYDADLSVSGFGTTISFNTLTVNSQKYYLKLGGLDQISNILSLLISKNDLNNLTSLINYVDNRWVYFQPNQALQGQIKHLLAQGAHFTSSDTKKLTSLYLKNEFLSVTKALPDEVVAGANSHHYQISVDSNKLTAFLKALPSQNVSSLSLSSAQAQYLLKQVNRASLAKHPINLWINKSNKIIDQIGFQSTLFSLPTTTMLTLSKINQPINITAPSSAISAGQFITQVTDNQVAKQLIFADPKAIGVIKLVQKNSALQ